MNNLQRATVEAIIETINTDIIGDRSFSDEDMIEALEEISATCDVAVEAKREELRGLDR